MRNFFSKIIIPNQIVKKNIISTNSYSKYIIKPIFEGLGHSFGNIIRRTLLNSICGMSIIWVCIEGIRHEFQYLEGVVEDVPTILLNLKKCLVIYTKFKAVTLKSKVLKKGLVLAKDLIKTDIITLVNPNLKIFTITKNINLNFTIHLSVGRGFWLNNTTSFIYKNLKSNYNKNLIFMDCLFSPVTSVKYDVNIYKKNKIYNVESLVLEIWTDGRTTPDLALNEAILLLKNYLNVFKISYGKNSNKYISNSTYENEELIKSNKILNILNTSVNEIELSVRSINCLNSANITTVGELCSKTETDMLKYKNFGKKSLLEIKNKLKQFNLKLGMSFADKI